MNPKEFVHNYAYSVQLPYIAGLSLTGPKSLRGKNAFNGWFFFSQRML